MIEAAHGRRLDPARCAAWRARIETPGAWPARLDAAIDPLDVWAALVGAGLHEPVRRRLGAELALNLDRCHVRSGRPPHHWHQDGALGFDFLAQPIAPADALLPMVTCWIALTPCGESAPGLEWVDEPLTRLLSPAELAPEAIARRFPSHRRARPVMAAGDVCIFGGERLHRTHLEPDMPDARISLELRIFPARSLPQRLSADRFVQLA